jgi:hypothetical protein
LTGDRIEELDEARREVEEIGRALEEIRLTSDPNRGIVCSRGCEAGCDHVGFLVAAVRADEEGR